MRNPELSFKEYETADYIEAVLRELPGIRVWPRIGKTGIVAELGDSNAVKCVALRADMDALPIVETTNLEFRSTVAGVSHACGHDGHVAMLLSTAEELTKCHLKTCRVRLIFQPAEELDLGALAMIEGGCMQGVDAIYGIHIWNPIPLGDAAIPEGPMMAGTDRVKIIVKGKGGHAASPHETTDPIFNAVGLLSQLYGLPSRVIDTTAQPFVFSIGQVHAGSAFNVIPDEVHIEGTIRFLHTKARDKFYEALIKLCQTFGAKLDAISMAPVTSNSQCSLARRAFGSSCKILTKYYTMAGEDFAYYLDHAPGAYILLGGGKSISHHSSNFDFAEDVLYTGVRCLLDLVKSHDFFEDDRTHDTFDFNNTPQYKSAAISKRLGCELFLKVECYNPIRCFKGRGATLFVDSITDCNERLITASVGNFGQAMALVCRTRKIPLTVYASVNAVVSKLERMRSLGADVITFGRDFDAAKMEAVRVAHEGNMRFVEDGSEPLIAEGCEAIGEEISRLNPSIVFVPVGNGALIIGLSRGVKKHLPSTRIIGVCAEGAPCMYEAFMGLETCQSTPIRTKADCIAVRVPIKKAVSQMAVLVDDMVLVSDDSMERWMEILEKEEGIVAEMGGVSGLAAASFYDTANSAVYKEERVVVIITGGNR